MSIENTRSLYMYRFDVSTDIETAEASRSSAAVGQMACQLCQNKAIWGRTHAI